MAPADLAVAAAAAVAAELVGADVVTTRPCKTDLQVRADLVDLQVLPDRLALIPTQVLVVKVVLAALVVLAGPAAMVETGARMAAQDLLATAAPLATLVQLVQTETTRMVPLVALALAAVLVPVVLVVAVPALTSPIVPPSHSPTTAQ